MLSVYRVTLAPPAGGSSEQIRFVVAVDVKDAVKSVADGVLTGVVFVSAVSLTDKAKAEVTA